ncbi:MAG: hypothetical protein AAFQ99_11195, partial [Pseudomonadota bacterium]
LADYLDTHAGNWRESELESGEKPEWLSETLDQLGWEILERINSATAVTPISMLALALLGTPRHALAMDDLKHQLQLYQKLFAQTPYSTSTTMPDMSVDEIIAHGLDMGAISIETDKLGEIAVLPTDQAVLLTYFRNNILHLTAVLALVAAGFINERAVSESELERFAALVGPYIRMELRLRWREDDLPKLVRIIVKVFCNAGMLIRDGEMLRRPPAGAQEAHALSQLGQAVVPILQRYFMAIVLMHRYGSGTLTQSKLEALCQLCAERLSILYGMRSPDFFDKRLFRAFASVLRDSGVTTLNADRCLEYEIDFDAIEQQARRVLGEPLRQAILVVTEVPENRVLGEQPSASAES